MFRRNSGKEILAKLALEQALNDGRTVCVVTPDGATIQKRRKHLTSITTVKPRQLGMKVIGVIVDEEIIK